MKKGIWILFLIVAGIQGGLAQTTTENGEKVLNDSELSDKQFAAWQTMKNNWLAGDYEVIREENKIKLNCKNCDSFYLEIILHVNENGKLGYCKAVKGSRCGLPLTKDMEQRIMRNFYKFEFPHELRNTTFKTRLGEVLKC